MGAEEGSDLWAVMAFIRLTGGPELPELGMFLKGTVGKLGGGSLDMKLGRFCLA